MIAEFQDVARMLRDRPGDRVRSDRLRRSGANRPHSHSGGYGKLPRRTMMPPSSRAKRQPTVFISYAHESDALRVSVKALADWLGSRDCRVLTDHLHADRPPPEGWQTWMQRCVEKAEMVLIVCTPRLKARYEKTEDIGFGRGAAYEGAIVTQLIYNDNMRN